VAETGKKGEYTGSSIKTHTSQGQSRHKRWRLSKGKVCRSERGKKTHKGTQRLDGGKKRGANKGNTHGGGG